MPLTFDLDARTAALSVGDFSDFTLGPRDSAGGAQGLWRAQLGTHWHNELRTQTSGTHPHAEFEIPISGQIFHRGWTLTLTGRIDQSIRDLSGLVLREIKTVTRALPADESELRADYPEYLLQLATYAALQRIATAAPVGDPIAKITAQLVFVEVGSGLAQTVVLTLTDDSLFRNQLERVVEFLTLRHRARERLQNLRFQPAFATRRPGQETTQAELTTLFERQPLVLFEAPTGFGKTGVLLEFALGQLRSGHFDRALYLTSKSTGQLQVVRTLGAMMATPAGAVESLKLKVESPVTPSRSTFNLQPSIAPASQALTVWQVRAKAEHCINTTFHCIRENCRYLDGAEKRWAQSGLARFYLEENQPRDLETLRAAGRAALICPYEITRAALAFNDVWIGDYNYVFAPRNRGLFYDQPGFSAARTLLIVDEAHNLPSRVADAHSQAFSVMDALMVRDELHRMRPLAKLVTAWEHWCHCLQHLRATNALSPGEEDDVRHLMSELAELIPTVALDFAALGPRAAELLWQLPALTDDLATAELPRLWWCPRDGELTLTCLDAAQVIGATLREFGGVVLASATLTPVDGFAAACGLDFPGSDFNSTRKSETKKITAESVPVESTAPAPERLGELTKRDTRKLYKQLTSAAELLRVEEARAAAGPALLRAHTPWREGAYDIAFDTRVDTTFQHRSQHYTTTAATVAALHAASGNTLNSTSPCVAVFFPSYAYAEAITRELGDVAPELRVALQPKLRDLAAQTTWVEVSLQAGGALFLVLGSSFAESIDALGGRIGHAMVVGPALPEVNAVQHARLAEVVRSGLTRDAAFRRIYQVPGMTKVNQALGRLVRAPGHSARVLLHCRRFLEPSYTTLLAPEYRIGTRLASDEDLSTWLDRS